MNKLIGSNPFRYQDLIGEDMRVEVVVLAAQTYFDNLDKKTLKITWRFFKPKVQLAIHNWII